MAAPAVETIAVLGTGYVGLTTACGLANVGNPVIGYDIDRGKIDRLRAGKPPFHEAGLADRLAANLHAHRLRFTTDLAQAVGEADMLLVTVPTLTRADGQADIGIVQSLVASVAEHVRREPAGRRTASRLIVVKSTVPPGTTDALAATHAEAPIDFAVNPEFLKEGTAVDDFERPDRVIIGVADKPSEDRLRRLYSPFVRNEHPILAVSRTSAEMIKYAANILLAGRISLINELANICKLVGVDVNEVRRGVGYDHRIGFEFLYPGIGFGGSCFPKDLDALIQLASQRGYRAQLLEAIAHVNRDQHVLLVQWAHDRLGDDLAGKTLTIWGLSYKPGTDDIRKAPALEIIDQLLLAGARVRVHDPAANAAVRAVFADKLEYFDDQYDALAGADALLICTEWSPFRRPDFDRMRALLRRPLILDGRNLYEPQLMAEMGFEYHSIGRPSVPPNAERQPRGGE
ncbi:MAG: UDP-glucose/GDP-mannose dehydrogenase family protein [Phycisphaerae bacterium]|nr:UDP-glucose/GDP-mannose dehydrogenase family protein [Phycisphaerae bacterium]